MALISPGFEITVSDESVYVPGDPGTVPFILIATAANKASGTTGSVASGTVASSAGNTYLISSQRELIEIFGNPLFYRNTSGAMIPGYELNEYGLMAAYSYLGVSNRAYVQRADIDLTELVGTATRPTGEVDDGTVWLDTSNTAWGLFVWNAAVRRFESRTPIVIDNPSQTEGNMGVFPKTSFGRIGDYAVVTTDTRNPVFFKNADNEWVIVGGNEWKLSVPAIIGTIANPVIDTGYSLIINGVSIPGVENATSVQAIVNAVDTFSPAGVTARNQNGRLAIYTSADSVDLDGTILEFVGIDPGTYYGAALAQSSHTRVPEWKPSDSSPRPTGSVWVKTTVPNQGANTVIKVYNDNTAAWETVAAPLYVNDWAANAALDTNAAGANITAGSFYVQYDADNDGTATYKLFTRVASGATSVTTGANESFVSGEIKVRVSLRRETELTDEFVINFNGSTADEFVAQILAAGIPQINAIVNEDGTATISHEDGGVIVLTGDPIFTAGINSTIPNVREIANGTLLVSNWVVADYTVSDITPGTDPRDGRMWYNSAISDVDVLIHDGNAWRGYRNVTNDARGYDLSDTDPQGPIVAAVAPVSQRSGAALAFGDLWIDTGDLENYPAIKRWEEIEGKGEWVDIEVSDQLTENGILFADARWAPNNFTDIVTDAQPSIAELATSDYLDLDAPDPSLYPRGMMLFNTRRSGFNVKRFTRNYYTSARFPDATSLPTEADAWVSTSGFRNNGVPYMGRKAVRSVVVAAMKAAIDTNEDIREEQREFNLVAAPAYHELITNMVALNNERRNTAFIVGDTPVRLNPREIEDWVINADKRDDGVTQFDPHFSLFWAHGETTDLAGNKIVVPPSHMMLRTIARSDANSYPWFAPAGVRRGRIDNADRIGYIDAASGEFVNIGIKEGLRDVLQSYNINPITFIPGTGIVNYGQKTRNPFQSAMDRINVVRLTIFIRTQLAKIVRPFIFEPNDKLTRDELKGLVEQMMNDLVARRAISDYLVVADESNNTPVRIDRNELWIDVAIVPVKSAEFIYVPIRIQNTGSI